ncbi:MAG: TonB-dependent receptor [Pyrinomonadaceae bacterium]|nr:TonB-dependent receptor [Sphingobacteriaceae bacterium]
MKLVLILCVTAFVQVSAATYAQRINLNVNNASLEDVLDKLRLQSGFNFLYNSKMIKTAKPVSLHAVDELMTDVLEKCFKNQALTFVVNENTVVIKKKVLSNTSLLKNVEEVITGTVVDSKGIPLIGVTIKIKSSSTGVVTDSQGNYKINVPTLNGILVFSSIGFIDEEVPINSRTNINVTLKESVTELDNVVIIGYGTRKKSDLTGSLSQVKGKEINAYPATNVLQALSGRAPGVQILQNTGAPGAPVSVRIRGTNSIQGSNEPLYVVDGFPISGTDVSVLNNADIESIDILKDASATAIYGSRGSNGVVIITTKRGKAGKTRVDIESGYSTQTLTKKLDLMNAKEYAMFNNVQAKNDNLPPYFTQTQIDALTNDFDWQDFIFKKAPMKTLSANVSGGNEKTQFSVAGSLFDQEGIIRGSDYKRYSFRANLNHELSKKFSVNLSSILTRINSDRRNSGAGGRGNSMISAAILAPPTLTPFNDDGSYRILALSYPFISNVLVNPINFINEQTDELRANRILTNASISYKPIPELVFKFSGGIENADDRTDGYTTLKYVNSPGRASVRSSQETNLLSENTVSYNKIFNSKHNISAVAGVTFQTFLNTSVSASGDGYISDLSQTYDLGSANNPPIIPGSDYRKSVLMSYLGRVNYIFNDKYLATISMRADGSSRLQEGQKWDYFPSAALAWRVSKEEFFKNVTFISDLKLRVGWGSTGNQSVPPYGTLNLLTASKAVFDNTLYTAYAPGNRLASPVFWETTEQKDLGLDFGIFKNRITISTDYYIKDTRDLLNNVALPRSLGYSGTTKNVGHVRNKGFDLGIDARALTGKFKWDINTNISFNRNKVIKLDGGKDILGGFIALSNLTENVNILREGRPIGQFYGYVEDGYTDLGKIKFKDINEDGALNVNDKTYIGNPNPDFIYGFNSAMSYKNFEFVFFIQGSQGNDLLNVSSIGSTLDYGLGLNMPKEVLYNHWSKENPNAKYPIISRTTSPIASNRWVEDGSYLRLKNIQLAYNLPLGQLGLNGMRNLQVYLSGQNLLTFTKYSWWDPEVNSNGSSNSTSQGFDYYSYPNSKTVTFGVRAGF